MNRKIAVAVALASLLLFPRLSRCSADQPTKESLLAAWEEIQRTDPHTKVFEKLSDNHYRFKTDWFPYDGELIVLNVVVAPPPEGFEAPWARMTMGTIEIELPGLTREQRENLMRGIEIWERSNTLYYDSGAHRWITSAEFQKRIMATARRPSGGSRWIGIASQYAVPLVLVVFLLFAFSMSRRSKTVIDESRRNLKISLEQQARMVQLLEQVVALLEKQSDKPGPP